MKDLIERIVSEASDETIGELVAIAVMFLEAVGMDMDGCYMVDDLDPKPGTV